MRKEFLILCLFFSFIVYSCKSNDVIISSDQNPEAPDTITDISEDISYEDSGYSEEDEIEVINEEVEPELIFIDDDEIIDEFEQEYIRSTEDLIEEKVSIQEFSDDKAEILRIIEELSDIMETQDVERWLQYISPDSIKYYSTPANVRKAQKKLPDKTIQLNGIGDYFKYVFIPSRKRSEVDEIRYISKANIKAVKVKSDGSINVYYYFVKIDDKWLVQIPTL